ncbi:putative MFS family arabinose efflux permease [Natranaerovirga hydrolytica]|uniref:Putative MFS family arabinose efflux permease n=1 Tax=Natranaerovirga hydrolytica TaxID=680378 RepID=A0A4R1MMV6_9FIRM|nr:MFS transporter [Natranaerovirga hydrolytica]TCK93232.1 putative MFS family arabinose efflux permease [Natranaerovirga hydrolytica]
MKKTLFMITTAFFWFSLYAYIPELSTYAEDLGATYKMIGLITGAYGFTQALLRIPLGIFSDTINRKKIFVQFGLIITLISCIITFTYPAVYSLLVTRILAGVAASTWVLFTVLFASYYKSEESPKAIGIINGCNAAGQLSAMLLGGVISLNFGTRYLYLLGSIGAATGLILSLFIEENRDLDRTPLKIKELASIALEPTLVKVSVLAILSQFITYATALGFVPIVARELGASSLQLSWIAAINIVPGIWISAITGTVFVKWWGGNRTLIYGFALSAILCILIPLVPNLWLLMVVQFLAGVGRSMVFPLLMAFGIKKVNQRKRATAMGFFQAIYGIGMLFGPIILGAIGEQFGLGIGFVITGLIGLGAIIIIMKYKIAEV